MQKIVLSFIGLLSAIAIALVALFPSIHPTHPSLRNADMVDLVPLRAFYADHTSRWRYRLSPDGQRLAWLEAKRLKPALWVRDLDGDSAEIYHTPDQIRWYTWSANGQYLLYQADRDGWENDQIVSFDVTQPGSKPRTYDFGKDVKSWIVFVPQDSSQTILVAHNARDRAKFDLYRLDLATGETTALDEISDRRVHWFFTKTGEIFARKRTGDKSLWQVEMTENGRWVPLVSGGMEDRFYPLAEPDADGTLLAISNMGRDKDSLVKLNIATGKEQVVYAEKDVDIGWVNMHPQTQDPIMVVSYPGLQSRKLFDERLAPMLEKVDIDGRSALHMTSITTDFSKAIWEVESDTSGWNKYLVDTQTGAVELFHQPPIAKYAPHLSQRQPVNITASDGLTVPAYITRPKNVSGPAPTVVLIHGGPVARSRWSFDDLTNWLANRGYAVLDVNYRGSDGYGRAFREAAIGEISGKMHQDIVDARAWAVEQGIADPENIAVLGGSFGGLKTLTAMTQSPNLFKAGISINGISDISTMQDEVPSYWTGWPDWYRKYIGDVTDPDDLAKIRELSPLFHAENVQGPILILQGSNDVRVIQNQSDRMVDALEKAGKDVRYEVIKGAGHTFANMTWQQRMIVFRKIERFLARQIGGRADGFDYAVLGAYIIP